MTQRNDQANSSSDAIDRNKKEADFCSWTAGLIDVCKQRLKPRPPMKPVRFQKQAHQIKLTLAVQTHSDQRDIQNTLVDRIEQKTTD